MNASGSQFPVPEFPLIGNRELNRIHSSSRRSHEGSGSRFPVPGPPKGGRGTGTGNLGGNRTIVLNPDSTFSR